jgi:hypothetical protein
MSLRITATTNTSPFDAFVDALDNFNEIADRVGRDVYDDYRSVVLKRLQEIPPAYTGKRQWTSIKQQRAFFASSGFGGGIPTVRTNAIPQAWDMIFVEQAGQFRILITNPNPASKFLYGGLSLRSNPRFQQEMHKITGWPTVAPIIAVYLESMVTDFKARFADELGDFGTITGSRQRAFTGR